MFLAQVLAPSTVVQFPAGTLVATVVSLMGTGALALWYLATRLTRLEERMATKADLVAQGDKFSALVAAQGDKFSALVAAQSEKFSGLATKADVIALGERLDRRLDDFGKEVHQLGERVAGLEGAVGYSRKAL